MPRPHPLVRAGAALGVLAIAGFLLWAWTDPSPPDDAPRGGWACARHFVNYGLFHGFSAGEPSGDRATPIPRALIEPGDVILCSNPDHDLYGPWSHATVVLEDGNVLAMDLMQGIDEEPLQDLDYYDRLLILRPRATPEQRRAAAAFARARIGGMFCLTAHPRDPRQWTCAKAAHDAYAAQGIELGDGRFWATPGALAAAADTSSDIIADCRRPSP
jgi:hypothetical protein